MSFTDCAVTVASRHAGVKPARMYLRCVAAWPVKLMSSHRTFRLRSFINLVKDMKTELLTDSAPFDYSDSAP